MKSFGIGIVLVIWFFCTLLGAVSILGLTLIVSGETGQKTTWMKIGERLTDLLKEA